MLYERVCFVTAGGKDKWLLCAAVRQDCEESSGVCISFFN